MTEERDKLRIRILKREYLGKRVRMRDALSETGVIVDFVKDRGGALLPVVKFPGKLTRPIDPSLVSVVRAR